VALDETRNFSLSLGEAMRKSIILMSAACVAVLTTAFAGSVLAGGTASATAANRTKDPVSSDSMPPLLAEDFPAPAEGFIVTTILIVADVDRSRDFYVRVFGAKIVNKSKPAILRISNSWLIINTGGGPTDDKPDVIAAPPQNAHVLTSALNIRVADIAASHRDWKARGADFITEPKDHGAELRCYIRDPDGYLIEVGQSTGALPK
jgi:lactoylglutathione lyase